MLPYALTIAYCFVATDPICQRSTPYTFDVVQEPILYQTAWPTSFESIRLDGLGLLFDELQHKRRMTPYYVAEHMPSSGDGTRYHLYVGRCVCLHQVFVTIHAIHLTHWQAQIYSHKLKTNLPYSPPHYSLFLQNLHLRTCHLAG